MPPKIIPYDWILTLLDGLEVHTRPMFGCTAVYVGEKIFCILRKKDNDRDNGVWLCLEPQHREAVGELLPSLRPIHILEMIKGWGVIPADSPTFEEEVGLACERMRRRDPRFGKVPDSRKPKTPKAKAASASKVPSKPPRKNTQKL